MNKNKKQISDPPFFLKIMALFAILGLGAIHKHKPLFEQTASKQKEKHQFVSSEKQAKISETERIVHHIFLYKRQP